MMMSHRRNNTLLFPLFMISTNIMRDRFPLPAAHALSSQSSSSATTKVIEYESFESMKTITRHFLERDRTASQSILQTSKSPILLSDDTSVASFIQKNYDTILFDCDGVLYRGSHLIPNIQGTIRSLLSSGKQIFFVTNNAGNSRAQIRQKLQQLLGIPQDLITENQILSSSYSCAKYIQEKTMELISLRSKDNKTLQQSQDIHIYVVGTQGLCDELDKFGFQVYTCEERTKFGMNREELASHPFDDQHERIDVVVCGLDTDFNYRKLCLVTNILDRNKNALFVATNKDAFDLVGEDGRKLPGNGSLVKSIEVASQRRAINVGKPSAFMSNLIFSNQERYCNPSRTLMVGDRLDTDIAFAKLGGMHSALVLTGVTTATKIIELDNNRNENKEIETGDEPMPDIIFPHAGLMAVNALQELARSFSCNGDYLETTNDLDQVEAMRLKEYLFKQSSLHKDIAESSSQAISNESATTDINQDVSSSLPFVSIDEGTHKYVLISAANSTSQRRHKCVVSRRGAHYHRNVAQFYIPKLQQMGYTSIEIQGGGRITRDDRNKIIQVFGYSYGFGQANHKEATQIIQRDPRYQHYNVIWSNNGY